ncbi:hypothetical protein E4U57_002845 [Claviceps arundinis]|uniref:Uncharacterized protein n=1 Tax=Claviceps arundinis TaxID=1623583 RepID=A0A9P7MT78_9HYPO|nr:hypothetical protein E4U57_002845 [Claviceps arundinis]KAG5968679.1 hypothetical protein E4U56_000284 [Claviceps arundinis]
MESSPVVKAHDHAAAAAVATRQSSDTTVAINEHTLAAGEFSNAAQSTTSIEALRTLKLLEEHHRQLAELLKLPPHQSSRNNDDQVSEKASQSEKGSLSPENSQSKKLPSLTQRGCSARDMSSSIASNLASARGIRSKYRGQPLSPSISNDQAPGNVEKHLRREGSRSKMQSIINTQPSRPTWVPPTLVQSPRTESRNKNKSAVSSPRVDHTTASGAAAEKEASAEDVGYARFYNTFGSIINKISAPLAFAGLPLIQEESTSVSEQSNKNSIESSSSPSSSPPLPPLPPAPKRKSSRPGPLTASILDPDLSKIYSKATMRALAREGHSATDSFYVVPTSGHTMSYANILSYAEKEKRRLSASHHSDTDPYHSRHNAEDEEEDFVDASETPPVISTSPGARRKGVPSRTEKELRNTIEELSLENRSLKDMLDNVSKRLHAFEASSQHSAMALAESYRIMRPGSPVSAAVSPPLMKSKPGDEALRQRTQDMEEQLAAAAAHMERLEKDNRKMQKTLDKYREKWEVLKAGAKARRGAQTESVEDS